jgi:HEAT repeat protein
MEEKSHGTEGSAITDLITKLGDKDGFVREQTRYRLIDIGAKTVPYLVKATSSAQQQIRWEAVKVLASLSDPAAVPALIRELQDNIFDIRWLAAEALIAAGNASIEPLLKALISESEESFLREGAHHVITHLMKYEAMTPDLASILKPVENALDSSVPGVTIPVAAGIALEKWKAANKSI